MILLVGVGCFVAGILIMGRYNGQSFDKGFQDGWEVGHKMGFHDAINLVKEERKK